MDNILENLKQIFSEVLLCPILELSLDKPYVDMGIDSILAIQVSKLINIKLNMDIQPSELYNHISIKNLAAFINRKIKARTQKEQSFELEENNCSNERQYNSDNEKIAIVGMAGTFPGAINVFEFWKNIKHKVISIGTSNRWGSNKYRGGFLENISLFDAEIFNISPKEAKLMDPQQRLLLQIAWQAFEDAGYTKSALSGVKCGVFTTSLPGDYRYLLQLDNQAYNKFSFTGNAVSVLAGRISHFFNLKGPCLNIDTACSSSLVCIDQAVKSIQAGDCEIAFIGATSIFCTSEIFNLADSSSITSKSGQCYSFDERADGFVPAEAVAGIVLTRLSNAKEKNRHVYGVIEAISTSHDGFTNGLMSPNGTSQRDLISSLYKKHSIAPQKIAYVEAHGTGTEIGDPLEFNALGEAFNENSKKKEVNCFIGTCKANIGHSLVASGLVGVIKALKAMEHNEIPPQANFNQLNPQICEFPISVNTELKDWPKEKPFACVSSFGFGGTNSHLVLEKYENTLEYEKSQAPYLFVFSANSTVALRLYLNDIMTFIGDLDQDLMLPLSYTLCCLREFQHIRIVVIANTVKDLKKSLNEYLLMGKDPFLSQPRIDDKVYYVGKEIYQGKIISCDSLFEKPVPNLHLPPYRFEGKPHWIESSISETSFVYEKKNDVMQVLEVLKSKICEILGYNRDEIVEQAPIRSLGIDSLVALQLLEPFKEILGVISPDVLFSQETLADLAKYIVSSSNLDSQKELCVQEKKSNKRLNWRIEGNEGENPLLLLPPLNTCNHVWEQQIHYFVRKGYKVFIPHYPGHARTPYCDFDLKSLSDLIWNEYQLLAKDPSKTDIFGWSLGGCLTLLLASQYSDYISHMILINTAAKFDRDIFSQSPQLRTELEEKEFYLKQLFKEKNLQPVNLIGAGCSLDILKHYYDQLNHFNVIDSLKNLKSSCLIIFGEKDSVINRNDVEDLMLIPNSILEVFPNEGHFLPLTSPYRFNLVVKDFIS